MNKWKKIASLLLALVMVFGLTATAFASDPPYVPGGDNKSTSTTTGKITVGNPIVGETYTIYKIFELVSYDRTDPAKPAYVYRISDEWKGFFVDEYEDFISYGADNIITWNGGDDEAVIAKFARDALAYAEKNPSISPAKTPIKAEAGKDVVFDNLPLGYYLIDSSAGVLCSLSTTDSEVTIKEKNEVPDLDKKIRIANGENVEPTRVDDTSVNVGDSVEFELSSKVPNLDGWEKYTFVFHDRLSANLQYNNDLVITIGAITLVEGDYTISVNPSQPSTSGGKELTVTLDLLELQKKGIKKDDVIRLVYTATLLEGALQTNYETNEAWLTYPKDYDTDTDTQHKKVYVYDFDVVIDKYAINKEEPTNTAKKLAGAQFTLKRNSDGKYYYYNAETGKVEWKDTKEDEVIYTTNESGKLTNAFKGLAAGTYTLTEEEAPAGYNKLPGTYTITITENSTTDDKGVKTVTGYTVKITADWLKDDDPGKTVLEKTYSVADRATGAVTVTEGQTANTVNGQFSETLAVGNATGVELPETGGIGTTIFYIVGGVLAAGAVVLLITKRRMNQ